MATIHHLPNRPESGHVTLRSGDVIHMRTGWLVRWVCVAGREHTTRVISDCDPEFAVLAVATRSADEFYEQLCDPVRVRI